MILIDGVRMDSDKLPRLAKRKVYELDNKYSRDNANPGESPRRSMAKSVSMPSSYTMFDPVKNDNVEVKYVLQDVPYTDPKSGQQSRKQLPHKVVFIGGIIVCQTNQPDLDFWLMNHPNRDRQGVRDVKFKLLSKEEQAKSDKQKLAIEYEALSYIMGPSQRSIEKQRMVLAVLSPSTIVADLEDAEVTSALNGFAKRDAMAFIRQFDSKETDYKLLIGDAKRKEYIQLAEDNSKWSWGVNAGSSFGKEIVAIPSGRSPVDYFLEWLIRSDNSGVLNELQIMVENKKVKAEKPVAITHNDGGANGGSGIPVNDPITEELKREAKLAGVSLQGIHKMKGADLRKKIDAAKATV